VFLHDVELAPLATVVQDALPALSRLVDKGTVHAIGVSGYPLGVLESVLAMASQSASLAPIKVVLSFCHMTVFDDTLVQSGALTRFKPLTGVINASTLGMGLLTTNGPPDWHPASVNLHHAASKVCDTYRSDISRIAMQWSFRRANEMGIASTLVGMKSSEEADAAVGWYEAAVRCFGEENGAAIQREQQGMVDMFADCVLPGDTQLDGG